MTSNSNASPRWVSTRRSFDALLERALPARTSFDEEDLLRPTHWSLGEDARLREDVRFKPTPWGRWIPSVAYVANDALFSMLHREPREQLDLAHNLAELDRVVGRHCAFCAGDPRFVLEGGTVRLSARELTDQPLIERTVGDLEKYTTHLPVHSLRAAAASLPAGEWGNNAQEQVIETLGWVRVSAGRKLNPRMFVAQIEGHSMDDGRSGMVDGGYVVFELWPSGTKQLLSVLVRGSFSDPETGSYAVKKYVADQRDEEGRHRRITLVSLNPDKERYPDIDLEVESDDDVTVVARVVVALSPSQFARRPRPVRRPGRRDIASSEAVAELGQALASHAERFFERLPDEGEIAPEEARASWQTKLVCLEPDAGGLHLEVAPLIGLWSFVKHLRILGADWETTVPAFNLRSRSTRIPVRADTGPWKWEAVGFEDDTDIDLSSLASAPLPNDAAVVFRVDAEGIGRQITSRALSLGQSYRLLLPDAVLASLAVKPRVSASGAGWWMWEVDLSSAPSADALLAIHDLRLEIGESRISLDWVLVSPVGWGENPRGIPFPAFLADPAPVLSVSGAEIESDGAARLFLHGPTGVETLSLPSGRAHLVRLEGLVPGQYAVMVLHDRSSVPPERVAFEIVSASRPEPVARCEVTTPWGRATSKPDSASVLSAHDLAALDRETVDSSTSLQVTAPPGWPVRVLWREISDDFFPMMHADGEGALDACSIVAATREHRTRRSIGDLHFDFAELGAVVIQHERRLTPEDIRERVEELVTTRGATAQRLAGAYADLVGIWFEPLCATLGYDLDTTPIVGREEPPDHVVAYRLFHTERGGSAIERHPVRVLFLVEDLTKPQPENLLAWLDDACATERLREVLISDGLRWAAHRRASRLAPRIWDLSTASKEDGDFVAFLREASEGV